MLFYWFRTFFRHILSTHVKISLYIILWFGFNKVQNKLLICFNGQYFSIISSLSTNCIQIII